MSLSLTAIGGPTLLIEFDGLRLLTDPTFDPPRSYPRGAVTLEKRSGPAIPAERIGRLDAVLLSHDQHADNLDDAGRALLPSVPRVLTTEAGAARLGGQAEGLAPWQSVDLGGLRITATPARHGPLGIEPLTGDVIGFVVTAPGGGAIYISGDTVWYEGVAAVAERFNIDVAILFTGSAKTRGSVHLTMDSNDAIAAAHAFSQARIVAVHHDGWAHFTESEADLAQAFSLVGLTDRLLRLPPGVATAVSP